MDMIFAVDRNWNIGYDGDMLFKISADLQRFKDITMGHVLNGTKTRSLAGGQTLPGREHGAHARQKLPPGRRACGLSIEEMTKLCRR